MSVYFEAEFDIDTMILSIAKLVFESGLKTVKLMYILITGLSPILYFDAILPDFTIKLSNIWCSFDRLRTTYGGFIKKGESTVK